MTEIYSPAGALPHIPDDLTVAQFILDYQHSRRPIRSHEVPWLIEDRTGRSIGLEELRTRTFGLANALKARFDLRDDDVVLVFSRNHIDYPVTIWAVHRLGGVISGANPDFTSDELHYQLTIAKASLIVAHPDSLTTALSAAQKAGLPSNRIVLFNGLFSESASQDHVSIDELVKEGLSMEPTFVERRLRAGEAKTKLAFLNFSSGTTGKPKAVAIPHISLITNVIQKAVHNKVNEEYTAWEDRRFRPGDIAIGVLPFYHIYGLVSNIHLVLFCGMSLVVVPKYNFIDMLKSIVRHRITHLMLVPPQVVLLCKHPAVKDYDLNMIRFIMVGAAPLTEEVNRQLFELFPNAHIGQAYGLTETCTTVSMWPISKKRGTSGSGGQLIPGVVARVVKPDGTWAGYDEPGELVVKTPSVPLGYYNNEEATKETFLDGWVRTGDEVKIDSNAEVWVLDRLKEIMKVKGYQVAPAELEGCLLDHPDVSDACVVGVPDDYSGEVPLAFVVLTVDAAQRLKAHTSSAHEIKLSIMKHVADNKVKYKHLAGGVEFVEAIPKNPSGKLLRRVLREKAKGLVGMKAKL